MANKHYLPFFCMFFDIDPAYLSMLRKSMKMAWPKSQLLNEQFCSCLFTSHRFKERICRVVLYINLNLNINVELSRILDQNPIDPGLSDHFVKLAQNSKPNPNLYMLWASVLKCIDLLKKEFSGESGMSGQFIYGMIHGFHEEQQDSPARIEVNIFFSG
ncbi:unnamed protein product [Urochloa humidicola]